MTALLAAMLCLLSGCLFRSVEDLYRLPERFPGYESLEEEISKVREELKVLGSTVEYASIHAGDNTATIQLHDLDGDGIRESALAFFRVSGAEKPLKIYIFTQTGEEKYAVSGVIEGEGTAIYAIDLVDINGKGLKELAVSWQTSAGVNQLGIYSLDYQDRRAEENQPAASTPTWENSALLATELMLTGYSGYYSLLDIDQDGRIEIAVPRVDTAGSNSYLEAFAWVDGAVVSIGTVSLSAGITQLNNIRSNFVADYVPALYLTSTLADESRVIDIITWRGGQLQNNALNPETGVSKLAFEANPEPSPGLTDINKDSILEFPRPRALPAYDGEGQSPYWLTEWVQYDAMGQEHYIFTTYHNLDDEWYFIIPEHWRDVVTVYHNNSISGQRAVIFSRWYGPDQEPEDFLAIYRLNGPNRFTRATLNNRFQLEEDGNVVYAATFYADSWDCGLAEADIMENFGRIITSWSSDG